MLADKKLYNSIDEIVEKAYVGLLFALVGVTLMSDEDQQRIKQLGLLLGTRSLIELLYIMIRNKPDGGYPPGITLAELLDKHALSILPIMNDAQQSTLDTGRAAFVDAIENSKNEVKKKIRQKLIDANRKHRQSIAVHRITNLPRTHAQKKTLKDELLTFLPLIMLAAAKIFERGLSSSMTDFINDTVVDSATANSIITGETPANIVVYKEVVNDGALCHWCAKFYTNSDGTPKEYTLAELQANGSNYGKPKSEWLPTIEKTHINCRCQLFYKKP